MKVDVISSKEFSPINLNIEIETESEYNFFKLLFGSTYGVPKYILGSFTTELDRHYMSELMAEIANKLNKH